MAIPDLPPDSDPLFSWAKDNVHANFAEHYSHLYDICPHGAITLAVKLTWRAMGLLLEANDDEDEGPGESNETGTS